MSEAIATFPISFMLLVVAWNLISVVDQLRRIADALSTPTTKENGQ